MLGAFLLIINVLEDLETPRPIIRGISIIPYFKLLNITRLYGHYIMGYLYLNLFLGPDLYLLTLNKRYVGQGYHGSPSKSFCVNATAVNYTRWQNGNVLAYRFKLREKG